MVFFFVANKLVQITEQQPPPPTHHPHPNPTIHTFWLKRAVDIIFRFLFWLVSHLQYPPQFPTSPGRIMCINVFKFPYKQPEKSSGSSRRGQAHGAAGQEGIGKLNARSKGARDQTLVTCDANDDFVFPSLKREGYCFFNKALNRYVT